MPGNVPKQLSDPAALYGTPDQLLREPSLSLLEKRRVLEDWEDDVRGQLVASEEGMTGPAGVTLNEIHRAKAALPIDTPLRAQTPIKA